VTAQTTRTGRVASDPGSAAELASLDPRDGTVVGRVPIHEWHVRARLMCHGGAMRSGSDGTQKMIQAG